MKAGSRETEIARALRDGFVASSGENEWWRGAAIYEVYIRSFRDTTGDGIGDLAGVTEKLDYISRLNVDGIWLSPFYPSPQKDFGYDITDFRNVDPLHGSMDDFLQLLESAHGKDLKVLLDFVPCHTSDEHPWFMESRRDRDNPRAGWYVWADAAPDGGPPNNWLSSFGGSAWTWAPSRSQYYYHPFLSCQPALDLRNPDVIEAILEEIRFWLDMGVDGLRLDAVQCMACDPDLRANPPIPSSGPQIRIGGGPNNPFGRQSHLFDRDVPEAIPILERLRDGVREYEPERVLIGELADMDSARQAEKYTLRGRRLHAVYDFDLINAPTTAEAVKRILARRASYLPSGWYYNVFSNHDAGRAVGNVEADVAMPGLEQQVAKLLIFLQFTLRGGGVLYQGDELGLPQPELAYEDLQDPWGRNLWPDFPGRDGGRTPLPWLNDRKHGGFTDGDSPWLPVAEDHKPLAVNLQEENPESCLRFVCDFLAWRKRHPVIRWGEERMDDADLEPLVIYDRFDDEDRIRFVVNLSADERWLPLDAEPELLDVPCGASVKTERGLKISPLGFAAYRP